jgi:phosphonate transport system substrate-binding protein
VNSSPRTPARSRRRAMLQIASAAAAVLATGLPGAAGAQPSTPAPAPSYTLGIVPYFSPSRLEEIYAPAAAELSRSIGREVLFRTSTSWDKYFAQLKAQSYDIAFVHALFYLPAHDEFGYLPLARMREPFTAVVVVPDKSPVRTVNDLRDKIVATPPSFLPTVHLAKKTLRDHGLVRGKNITFEETKTVDACLQQALVGAAQACIAPPFAANAFQASGGVRLRVVLETAELPSPVFVVHRRVPEAERERIRAALLQWNQSANGQAVLKSMNTRALVPASDADYQPVRTFVRSLDEPWLPSAP